MRHHYLRWAGAIRAKNEVPFIRELLQALHDVIRIDVELVGQLAHRRRSSVGSEPPVDAEPNLLADLGVAHDVRSARLTMMPSGPRTDAIRHTSSYSPTRPISP